MNFSMRQILSPNHLKHIITKHRFWRSQICALCWTKPEPIEASYILWNQFLRYLACKLFDVLKMMNDLKQVIFMSCSASPRSSFKAENRAVILGKVHTFPWPQYGIEERYNMKWMFYHEAEQDGALMGRLKLSGMILITCIIWLHLIQHWTSVPMRSWTIACHAILMYSDLGGKQKYSLSAFRAFVLAAEERNP